jgi:hypothetical protein
LLRIPLLLLLLLLGVWLQRLLLPRVDYELVHHATTHRSSSNTATCSLGLPDLTLKLNHPSL